MQMRPLNYHIAGIQAVIGDIISMQEWAERAQIPNRKGAGILSGETIERILGIRSKSWDFPLFSDQSLVARVAASALESAAMRPQEIDAVLLVTCTPYQVLLDQDAFYLLRSLGIPDQVVPMQLSAGCAGLARAMAMASQISARNVLIVTYNLASLMAHDEETPVADLYRENIKHPLGSMLWTSPAIFSDAAAALVLRQSTEHAGHVLYTRDSQSFGDESGFEDPLIHVLAGGARCPATSKAAAALAPYGMSGEQVKRYYTTGMMLNHEALNRLRPGYLEEVKRIYTHQASPALIADFVKLACFPIDKTPSNAQELGNLVTPCTIKLLHDDLLAGRVNERDELCFSVVGAGPERGTFLIRVGPVAATPFEAEPPVLLPQIQSQASSARRDPAQQQRG